MEKRSYLSRGGLVAALFCGALLVLVALGMPSQAQAAQVKQSWEVGSPTASDVTATLYDDGSLVFSGKGNMHAYTNRGSSRSPWHGNSLVKSVRFKAGVTPSDLTGYFDGCENLVTVESIPASVTVLDSTFLDCSSLKKAPAIPSGVTDMTFAFSGCSSLAAAPAIPAGVTNLFATFAGCTSFTSAPVIPSGVMFLEKSFLGCTSLKAAPAIPSGVKGMQCAFSGCTSLTKLPDGLELPGAAAAMSAFYVELAAGAKPLKTYVNAPVDESVLNYDWASDNRELVVVGNDSASWKRLAGGSALTTMKAVVNEGWSTSEWAVVATSEGYHDALSASGLAGLLNAPVMLTPKNSLSNVTRNLIKSKKVKSVIVVGGRSAVSDKVFSQIGELGVSVKRVAGGTAATTARAVYREGLKHGGWGSDAILATSTSYQDALSIAPYSYANKAPIFLTNLNKTTADLITVTLTKSFSRTLVIGGEKAVAKSMDGQLRGAKRLAGTSAYSTSKAVANFCLGAGMTAAHMGVARGDAYQDALCGAALLGKKNSIIVLADDNKKTSKTTNVNAVVKKNKKALRKYCYIFGGTKAVSTAVENKLKAASK